MPWDAMSSIVMHVFLNETHPLSLSLGRMGDIWIHASVVSYAATDAWIDMSPMGPRLRDSGCVSLGKTCITILDIASHDIAHLLLMNLNTCFADLVSVFLWRFWLLNIELLLRMCKLIECGYWVVYLVNCKLLDCSVEDRYGVRSARILFT